MNESTVLIVDDQETARSALEGLLTPEGYRLVFAGDGLETILKAEESRPDLILLDVMLPEMDGYEVCRRLRENADLADVPIIMITSLDDQASRVRGLEAGADDFIAKPFDKNELRARVRTVTRLNRFRRRLLERDKFEWVVERATDGYVLIGADDRILYANAQARLLLDLPDDQEEQEASFLRKVSETYRKLPEEAWESWPRAPEPDLPRYLLRPESSHQVAVWLEVETRDFSAGKDSAMLVRLADISERMALHADVWKLHSLVSHKLCTPLSGLLGMLNYVCRDNSNFSNEESRQCAGMALTCANGLSVQVEEILEHLGSGNLVRSERGFPLRELREMVNEVSLALELETVTVEGELPEGLLLLEESIVELVLRDVLRALKDLHQANNPPLEIRTSRRSRRTISIEIADEDRSLSPELLLRASVPLSPWARDPKPLPDAWMVGFSQVSSFLWSVGGKCNVYGRKNGPGVRIELLLPAEEADEA